MNHERVLVFMAAHLMILWCLETVVWAAWTLLVPQMKSESAAPAAEQQRWRPAPARM